MDRRKMLALLGTSPALLAGSPVRARPAGLAEPAATPVVGAGKLSVLNPAIAGKFAERFPLVPRLASLEGKTLYMIDIQWGGAESAYSFFEAVQDWFAKNMPSVKTVFPLP